MSNKYLKQSIDRIDISCQTINKLKPNNINDIQQLSNTSKYVLQKYGVSNEEIELINNEMLLLGLNLG